VITCDLVRSHSANDLLVTLKTRGVRSSEFSRALCKYHVVRKLYIEVIWFVVKQKMSPDYDSEVATTSLRVSLMCPVCYIALLCNAYSNNNGLCYL